MSAAATVRLLLLDADAVIQRMPDRWLEDVLGQLAVGWGHSADDLEADAALWGRARAVLDEIFAGEVSLLSGGPDDPSFPELIAEVLSAHDNTADAESFARNWHRTVPLAQERALVAAVRRRGIRVAMGTNQQPHRAAWLAESGQFADLCDEVYTSSRVGVAKPSPDFFRAVLAAEAEAGFPAEPSEVVFIDDRADNVAGAQEAGLVARQYHYSQGAPELREALEATGVLLLHLHDGPGEPDLRV